MRKTFINTLIEIAEEDKDIYLLTGDLGFNVLEPFMNKFQDRFINAGIGEANMVSVATGIALRGKKAFAYSITPFVSFKAIDQIRMASYMNQHIVVVGVGRGEEYHNAGISHYDYGANEAMNSFPLTVLKPKTQEEVRRSVIKACKNKGTYFLSLSVKRI